MVRFRRQVLFHLLQQYLQCQCTFKICNYLCQSYSGVHLGLKYLLGGLYHSSIIKSFAWCYSVLILVVSPGPCTGSYIEQGNLLLYLTLLQYFPHSFQYPRASFPSFSGWKNNFSQNFSPCPNTQLYMTGFILETKCQTMRENKIMVIPHIHYRSQGFF